MIAFVIFLAAILSYFGIIFGYQPFLESGIREKDGEISKLADSVSKQEQEKFIQFYSQLVNLKVLLDNHANASKAFPFLERVTHQKVFYQNATLKVPERELELEGAAESYLALAEQLESFARSSEVERYLLTQSQLKENLAQFKVVLKLKDTVLK